jgi:sugar lactone lactonase YvrE
VGPSGFPHRWLRVSVLASLVAGCATLPDLPAVKLPPVLVAPSDTDATPSPGASALGGTPAPTTAPSVGSPLASPRASASPAAPNPTEAPSEAPASRAPASPAPVALLAEPQAPGTVVSMRGTFPQFTDVAVDKAGNYYLVDAMAAEVVKVSPDGRQSRIGASGMGISDIAIGADDTLYLSGRRPYGTDIQSYVVRIRPGAEPELLVADSGPKRILGLAVNRQGEIYLTVGDMLKVIRLDGTSHVLAGAEQPGDQEGAGAEARFNYPHGIAVDAAGMVYVADTGNRKIKRVTPDGVVTAFASTTLNVWDMAIDAQGNLYGAADSANVILKITSDGASTVWAGDGTTCYVGRGSLSYRVAYDPAQDPCAALVNGPRLSSRFLFVKGIGIEPGGALAVTEYREGFRRVTPD